MAAEYSNLIEPVARHLWGEPNEQLSKPGELRFGTHGSKAVDVEKNTFFDHEANEGGGVIKLVQTVNGIDKRADAHQWLVDKGFIASEESPGDKVMNVMKSCKEEKARSIKQDVAKTPGKIVSTYDYRDESRNLLMQVVRLEPKTFRQRRPNGDGWSWSVKGVRVVPYRLPELLAAPDAVVYLVEGEKDADRLASLGLVATCNAGGAGKWRKDHSEFLRGRRVVVIPDNDEAGREHVKKAVKSLAGIASDVRVITLPGLPEKGDVSDWLDAGGTAEELLSLAAATEAREDDAPEEKERESQADQVVKFAQGRYEFLHDDQKNVYARSKSTGIVCRLGSRAFRDDVYAAFFDARGKGIKASSFAEALDTLTALGVTSGEPQKVFLRAGHHSSGYYLDLCQPGNSQAVHLSSAGWRVVDKPPIVFVRGEAMQPLPQPVAGGSLGMLWELVNVPEDARLLMVAFIVDAYRTDGPFAGLELLGEQGSGKSLTAKFIRRLIDPNACDLRGAPKTVEDIFVVAGHSHLATFENISHLHGSMQDALCILSTGGGIAKRTLYSNDEESIISVQRPWIINGISAAVTQQDLLDRTVSIDCPVIEERGTATGMHATFEKNHAVLLGAVLEVAAQALKILPSIKLPPRDRPRLAEFALLGMAVAQAMGHKPQEFMHQFNASRRESIARVLDASPVASAVLEFVEANPGGIEASVKDILHRLEDYKPQGADAWPRSPKGLGDALRRAAPALRQMDVECRSLGNIGGKVRWLIKKKKPIASHASHEVMDSAESKHDFMTSMTSSPQVLSTVVPI